MIDGTIVRAHQQTAGAKKGELLQKRALHAKVFAVPDKAMFFETEAEPTHRHALRQNC